MIQTLHFGAAADGADSFFPTTHEAAVEGTHKLNRVLERHRQTHINESRELLYEELGKLQKIIEKLNAG